MRFTLLANAAAFALFAALTASQGLCRWELLLIQLVLQALTNEFWIELFMLPFKGQHLFGLKGATTAAPARVRRVARWTGGFLLLFPALVYAALACINYWAEGSLLQSLRLPPGANPVLPSLAAQGLLFAATLLWGLVPLSYRTLVDALLAYHESRLAAQGTYPADSGHAPSAPPTHAGVEALPHGLPKGVELPDCLRKSQRCSPLHSHHAELVRTHLQEGELAILSTAPAGVVPLPSSSNERLFGGLALCLGALLLYTALDLFEEGTSRIITRWVVLLLGLGLLPVSIRVLRSAARRQALLLRTDYFLTNLRLHICCAGEWQAVVLGSMEVVPGGSYGSGRGDVDLCPESGAETYNLVNVEHAEELCTLLERLIYMENAR